MDQFVKPISALEELYSDGVGVVSREWASQLADHNQLMTDALAGHQAQLMSLKETVAKYTLDKDLPTGS